MTKKDTKTPLKNKIVLNKKQTLFVVLTVLIAAGAIYVFSGWANQAFYVNPRYARVQEIYRSLNLSSEYIPQFADISGQKRVYDWDKNRSHSSEMQFLRGADVKTTADDLDAKIKAIGFEYFDEPYAGSAQIQYHYKSKEGEYIRMSVSSKLRDDAFQNFFLMNRDAKTYPDALFEIDKNAGPSNVTIKVNLDDNNE